MEPIIETGPELTGMISPDKSRGPTEKVSGDDDRKFSSLMEAFIDRKPEEDQQGEPKTGARQERPDSIPIIALGDVIQNEDALPILNPDGPLLEPDDGQGHEALVQNSGRQENNGGRKLSQQLPEGWLPQKGQFKSGIALQDLQFVKQGQSTGQAPAAVADGNVQGENSGPVRPQMDVAALKAGTKVPVADPGSQQQAPGIPEFEQPASRETRPPVARQQPLRVPKGKHGPGKNHNPRLEPQVPPAEQHPARIKSQVKFSVPNQVQPDGKAAEKILPAKEFEAKSAQSVQNRSSPGAVEFVKPREISPGTTTGPSAASQVPKGLEGEIVKQALAKIKLNKARIPSRASIRLKPEHLGRLRVELRADGHQVSIKMTAENHAVKEILEANLGHLRNELQQQGMDLKNVEVFVGRDTGQQRQADTRRRSKDNRRIKPEQVEDLEATPLSRKGVQQAWQSGELDTFI